MEMDIARDVVMVQAIPITMIITMEFIKEILNLMVTQEEVEVTSTQVLELMDFTNLTISIILNKLPTSASNLYAKNLFNFVLNLYDKESKKINLNMEDEIINKTLIKEI